MVIILNFLFKIAGNINHGYSPLKIFCRRSCHFFLFMGERYAYHMCVQNGWDGGHWSLLRKFYAATTTWLTVMEYLCHKWPRKYSTCRKHVSVLSSFITYQRILIKKNRLLKYIKMNGFITHIYQVFFANVKYQTVIAVP